MIQKKTSTPVVVPIMNDNLLRIAERYDFNIPEISDVILNRYHKDQHAFFEYIKFSSGEIADKIMEKLR